jgi:hypothetical protein
MLEKLWFEHLNEVLQKKFSASQIARVRPTFGVEHEFFILNTDGSLASGEKSQAVFEYLASQPEARVFRDQLTHRISQINFEHPESNSYSVLKYEFFPHLLEIAIGYSTRDDLLERRIFQIYELVKRAVMRAGLQFSKSALLPLYDLTTESINAFDVKRRDLHEGRKIRLMQQGHDVIDANFPAFTAGTQVQVGGIKWWENIGLLSRLYDSEPENLRKSFQALHMEHFEAMRLLRERFDRYSRVYATKKLIGFPKYDFWSLEKWSNFLTTDLGIEKPKTKDEVIAVSQKVHDLSLIAVKPNMATLEFRGCPSLPDCEEIVGEIKRRKKQFLEALSGSEVPDLKRARAEFYSLLSENPRLAIATVESNE